MPQNRHKNQAEANTNTLQAVITRKINNYFTKFHWTTENLNTIIYLKL